MKQEIILLGGGGHCKSVIDVIEQQGTYQIRGILDVADKVGQVILGYPIIGTEEDLANLMKNIRFALITVGQVKSSTIRKKLYDQVKKVGGELPVIISPRAYVSPHSQLGEGSIIMHGACINAGAKLGVNTIINSQALIEHDVHISDHCHISTGAIINGDCRIGSHVMIGSQATLRQGITISDHVLIGMGSVVLRDINQPGIYAGVPAKKMG